jgi:hypothetical protein
MSKYMLNDEDAINDVNPFVTHDFSLPGGVRQTGGFNDFVEMKPPLQVPVVEKSVFCGTGLCKEETEPCLIKKKVHPRRNVDCGFTRPTKKVTVGVSNQSVPYFWIFLVALLIVLGLLFVRR